MKKRTDAHRVSQIMPCDYAHVLTYTLSGGNGERAYGVNCEYDFAQYRETTPGASMLVALGKHAPSGRCCASSPRSPRRAARASARCAAPTSATATCGST